MFEKETKFLYDFSMNQMKQLGSYITFDELSRANLHPAVIRYISAEIDYLINEDRHRLLNNSNFDYSGEEINRFFTLITKEIKRTKKFSLDYIGNIILHAISFNINYIAQPNWAVVKLIFAKDATLKANEVLQILKYVYYYDYVPELIATYIKKKNLLVVDKVEIEALLLKADKEIFTDSPSKLVDRVLFTIGEFVNIGSVNKSRIPLLMFELYLKEKSLDEYWERLENALGTDVKQIYEIAEIQKMLHSPSSQVKKENYLDRIIHQDGPLGLFKRENKKEFNEADLLTMRNELAQEEQTREEQLAEDEQVIEQQKESQPHNESTVNENTIVEDETEPGLLDEIRTQDEIKLENETELEDEINVEDETRADDEPIAEEESKIEEKPAADESIAQEDSQSLQGEESLLEIELESEDDFIFLEEETDNQLADLGESLLDFTSLKSMEELTESEKPSETEKLKENEELKENEILYGEDEVVIEDNEIIVDDEIIIEDNELKEALIINDIEVIHDKPEQSQNKITEDIFTINEDIESPGTSSLQEDDIQNELDEFFSNNDISNDVLSETQPDPVTESFDAPAYTNNDDEDMMLRYLEETELNLDSSLKAEDGRKKDLTQYFKQREIQKIISSVFNDNMKSLAQTFEELEKCSNIAEAEEVLNSVFVSNMVSPSSKGAKILRKNLTKYYNQV